MSDEQQRLNIRWRFVDDVKDRLGGSIVEARLIDLHNILRKGSSDKFPCFHGATGC